MKYKCSACGYIYDEAVEDIKFQDLPEDWVCPKCGAPKEAFELLEEEENYYDTDLEEDTDEELL
ncbi:MAG: rubredoxin [Minisyncoccia bacterium]